MIKTKIRFRIEKLLVCAKITTDDKLREELVAEALDLLDEMEDNCKKENWLEDIVEITDGKYGRCMKRSDFYSYYLRKRAEDKTIPNYTRNALYQYVRDYGVREWKGVGDVHFAVIKRECVNKKDDGR